MRSEERQEVDAVRARAEPLLGQFSEVWRNGREYVARCPLHADKTPSLTIYQHAKDGVWMWRCFPCGRGGDVFSLLKAQGMSFPDALKELGADRPVVFSKEPRPDKLAFGKKGAPRGRVVAEYNYTDEQGVLLYQVVRMDPKDFRQRKPDGRGGWIWRLGDVRRVLYRLPHLIARKADTVYVVEGEKDADRLEKAGLLATTNCGGAGAWRPHYAEALHGRRVVILPDNDDAGRKHAHQVFDSLVGTARSIRIHRLRVPAKGDVSDWLSAGHSVQELPR